MRRIEILELTSFEGGGETKREDVKYPTQGLLIGTTAPNFELSDTNGRNVSLETAFNTKKIPVAFLYRSELRSLQSDVAGN